MIFNSYDFLFCFLPVTLGIYYITPQPRRNLVLTIFSYLFYAYWDYRFCALLLGVTFFGYICGKGIQGGTGGKRKWYLIIAICLNLSVLCYFKYAGFFITSLNSAIPLLSLPVLDVVLPIGVSFFIFQALSYVIDVYCYRAKPVKCFTDFACYIAMFPQLIAGPIVRYSQIDKQLCQRVHNLETFGSGVRLFITGLAKKVLLADTMAGAADQMFQLSDPSFFAVWLGVVAFSLQIYFDFSGYSDMAIGLGRFFGFYLPENFHFPYQARGIADFWRRWHMSLSGWLRDYLYIPLGGARCGLWRNSCNLILTMTLCGLWHGASWTYVVWGAYFGVLLVLERPFMARIKKFPAWLAISYTYFFVLVGWVFFRADSLAQAVNLLRAMIGLNGFGLEEIYLLPMSIPFFILLVQALCWTLPENFAIRGKKSVMWEAGYVVVFLACVLVTLGQGSSPFLYYQF